MQQYTSAHLYTLKKNLLHNFFPYFTTYYFFPLTVGTRLAINKVKNYGLAK